MKKIEHSAKYDIISLLFLIAYIAFMFVILIESLIPANKSAQRSYAVGSAVGGFINDLGKDQAKEIKALSCSIDVDSSHVFSVGESFKLNVETLPVDSTHKSYEYYSSDESIATISNDGFITFLKSGSVKIKVVNINQNDIFNEVKLSVDEIYPTSIKSKLENATYNSSGYYELEKSRSYVIKNIIEPSNSTLSDVTYTLSNTSIAYVFNDTLYLKEITSSLVTLTCKTKNDITSVIKFKVQAKEANEEKVMLESIFANNISAYFDQTTLITPTVKYNPTYTSTEYKGYILESLDEEICTISNNKIKLKGVVGSCNIKVISKYDSSIYTTINLTVKPRSDISSFDVNYSKKMYINDTSKITLKNIKPTDAKVKSYSFSSSDNNILEVTNKGVITAKSTGGVDITITVIDINNNTLTKTIHIDVLEKEVSVVDDFEINYLKGETPSVYIDEEIDLTTYFKISKFYNLGNIITPDDKTYYFSFDEEYAQTSSKVTFKKCGLINGFIYYVNSDESTVYKEISLYAISKFSVTSDVKSQSFNLSVDDYLDFKIEDNFIDQKYNFEVVGSSINYRVNNKNFRIVGSDSGKSSFIITPIVDEILVSDLKYIITFNVSDIYTNTLNISFYKNKDLIEYSDDVILYVNHEYSYKGIVDDITTKYNVFLTDNELIDKKYDKFIPLVTGDLTLEFVEEYSNIVKTYNFKVRNFIKIDSNKTYKINGDYNISNGKVEITNGSSASINLIFSKDSTYKLVTYKSTDEKILKVYNDGTIEPKSSGEASIIMKVDDGFESHEYSVDFKVNKKNVIEDITQFSKKIRKSIGHYGAFFVLAILATVTFALLCRGKMYFVGVTINFVSGFLFAAFTEYVQTLTPKRAGCMSDILIDYTGYISAAILFTTIFTLIYGIKYIRNKKTKVEE